MAGIAEGDNAPSDEADDDDARVATAAGHMSCEKYIDVQSREKRSMRIQVMIGLG